jgi:hypothetical protein
VCEREREREETEVREGDGGEGKGEKREKRKIKATGLPLDPMKQVCSNKQANIHFQRKTQYKKALVFF